MPKWNVPATCRLFEKREEKRFSMTPMCFLLHMISSLQRGSRCVLPKTQHKKDWYFRVELLFCMCRLLSTHQNVSRVSELKTRFLRLDRWCNIYVYRSLPPSSREISHRTCYGGGNSMKSVLILLRSWRENSTKRRKKVEVTNVKYSLDKKYIPRNVKENKSSGA